MRATIYLARHGTHAEVGRVLSGRSEIPLSDEGVAQAQRLGLLCRDAGVTCIQTSPRRRALETATIVGDQLGLEPDVVDALDEIDFGAWSGRSFADLAGDADWQHWNSRRAIACPPGGEPMGAAAERAMRHLQALADNGRSHVLCVSHCDIIRGVIASYSGIGYDRMLEFEVEPGSLSSLIVQGDKTQVIDVNRIPQ